MSMFNQYIDGFEDNNRRIFLKFINEVNETIRCKLSDNLNVDKEDILINGFEVYFEDRESKLTFRIGTIEIECPELSFSEPYKYEYKVTFKPLEYV